ncbi:MAG: crotonase/enoyl-CoA hydratase family protein [Microscillaceae bacterium]|jgi:enoyl-CoA hydratase|nr:crotonase/enoyl-CoA hydratase family protein [Microscillaceae bacterium]
MNKTYETVVVGIENHIAHVKMNNPSKANAMTPAFWTEFPQAIDELDANPEVRVVIVSGEGKHFTAGLDLTMFAGIQQKMTGKGDQGRIREDFRREILRMQDAFTALERCRKPVIAAIHGACVGGGIDLISACDMRYCAEDAYFCVKEIDIAIVADVGTLQRLPKIIADGVARELAYTARKMGGKEAEQVHLVNKCYTTYEEMMSEVFKTAQLIAAKSPLAMRGTKEMLNYTRNHTIEDSLNYVATWNAAMLMSNDAVEAAMSSMQKREAKFEN